MNLVLRYGFVILALLYFSACKHHKTLTDSDKENSEHLSGSKELKKKYAEKLGVSPSEIKNEKLYQFINEWYGVPYKYAGKDKYGIDCSGLTSTLYNNVYKKTISCSTKALVGEVKKVVGRFVYLKNASWIPDSGRFMNAIKDGTLNEIEPVGTAFVNLDTVVDFFPWIHKLPKDQK